LFKKSLEATEFYKKKMGQKNVADFLVVIYSKLSHFDNNLNLNPQFKSQMVFTNLEKTDMVLIYGEAREYSELTPQIYGERFPQRTLPNARTFVNVVQHLPDLRRFEMNERDLGPQREDCILIAEEEIVDEIKNQPRTSTQGLANHLGVSQFVV
jgi:hypothetical protein